MTTNSIIVEDDPKHGLTLQELIGKLGAAINIAGIYATVEEAIQAIHTHKPSLIFLDIDLEHGGNGFDLLDKFPDPDFSVIFTTQHKNADNAIQAIRACALDFLPKPILEDELRDALARLDKKQGPSQLSSLKENISSGKSEYIWLTDTKGKTQVAVANILYCESDNVYTHFYLQQPVNGLLHYTESKSIKTWETILTGTQVIRTHREFLLNLDHSGKYCKAYFLLANGTRVPVSRSRKQQVEDSLRRFRKGH